MEAERFRATGWIEVTSMEKLPWEAAGGGTLEEAQIAEEFSGGLAGNGASRLLMFTAAGGAVTFSGMERFSGTLGERLGSFVFRNAGRLENGEVSGEWIVIAGSGTGELSGLRGEGGCRTADGYWLDYWFE
jgi:hypothetical protein